MDDISGKKFSLQDWVMKRAANQSGVVLPPVSARQVLFERESDFEERSEEISIEVEMKSVSNGSSIPSSAPAKEEAKMPIPTPAPKDLPKKEDIKDIKESPVSMSSAQNPLQQLQIVRLLTDLGDRLRQSEKEREVLWKEVEICRKQITEMGGREGKTEKTYIDLESQMNQREVFVKELVEKQMGLEQKLKEQLESLDASKQEQAKLQEKMNSIETAAGSAIVRVEDAIAENSKLSKRVEQLSQDKARLVHKLEVVEEALTQTQDILRAKALVLLTDQALASRTNLPQTPAWTGNDTLKVSTPAAEAPAVQAKAAAGPLAGIAESLRAKRDYKINASMAALIALIVFGVVGGIVSSYYFGKSGATRDAAIESEVPATGQENLEPSAGSEADQVSNSQDDLMARAAEIANQIEPSGLADGGEQLEPVEDNLSDGVLPRDFEVAQTAQDKAVSDFKATAPTTPVIERIKADKSLPKAVVEIQQKALAGDAEAQHDLAAIYTAGHGGVKVNYAAASKWFEEAAYGGVANAQYNLAVLYHQGLGVKKDTAKAIELYRVAASNNHPEAQYNLAIAYVEGVGVEYNPQIASVYFEQAASGGIVEAAYNLGLLQENGLLGESQPDEAIFWYTLAADKKNPDAVRALKQLKDQLSMGDEDAGRVAQKIAAQKPAFLNEQRKPSLPELKKVGIQKGAAVASPVDITPPAKKSAVKASVAVAPAADPVIVSQIQEQLIRLGIYKGIPNGTNSPVLAQAIKTYQQKNGMKADGVPSDDLLVNMLASGVEAKQITSSPNN